MAPCSPRSSWLVALSLAALLPACAADAPADHRAPQAPDLVQLPITLDYEATLAFNADWQTVTEAGPIKAGGRLKLRYAAERLPNCRATKYGQPAWSILAYWQAPGHDATYVPLTAQGGMLEGVIAVPEDLETIEVWFYNNDYYGCREYDSANGANYTFEVTPPAEAADIVFTGDWAERTEGDLEQGGLMRLRYAPERLQACRAVSGGTRAWNIYAGWRFLPGGQTDTVALYTNRQPTGSEPPLTPEVVVPDDATSVELWFSNTDTTGCSAWDSNYGANYSFTVSPADTTGAPPVGWIGDYDWTTFGNSANHRGDVDPFWYWDSWAGMPMGAWVDVQVWIPGVTDVDHADPAAAAASLVDARAITDAVPVDGDGDAWGSWELAFDHQQGNNFVYRFRYPELRWQIHGNEAPDGLYRWSPSFSTDGGVTWTNGEIRRFAFAASEDCSLFPDGGPASCPQDAAIGWVGDWGQYRGHQCTHVGELEDPKVYTKSAVGHDCMTITADVWVEGLTDAGGNPAAILAQVETDLDHYSGPLATPTTHALQYDGVVGNNYRFKWNVGQLVGSAERGDYTYRFRFSVDGGKTWTRAGADGGEGYRALHIRNDSTDTDLVQYCDGIETWSGPTSAYPYCLDYQPSAHYDANYCELWVNAFGQGEWNHGGVTAGWLEAWVRVAPEQDGEVEVVGMWISYDEGGESQELISIGSEVEPDYWKTGLTTTLGGMASGAPLDRTPTAFAVFVDVRRPAGHVERLWLSGGGSNYTVDSVFAVDGYHHNIGSGSVEYADESVSLFDAKKSCAQ